MTGCALFNLTLALFDKQQQLPLAAWQVRFQVDYTYQPIQFSQVL